MLAIIVIWYCIKLHVTIINKLRSIILFFCISLLGIYIQIKIRQFKFTDTGPNLAKTR